MSSSVLCLTSIPGFIDNETAPSPALSPAIAPCPLTTRLIALSSHRMVHVDGKGIPSGSSKVVYSSADLDMSSSGSDILKLEERGNYRKRRYLNYPSSIPKWAPVGPIRGPFGARMECCLSGLTVLGSIRSSNEKRQYTA